MSASAPNPSNLLLLAGLGIGAYWLMTRQARATQSPTPAQIPAQAVANPYRSVVGDLAGRLLGGLLSSSSASTATAPFTTQGGTINNPSAYASSAIDGIAFNPPVGSAFDSAYISAGDVPSLQVDEGWKLFQ
jgi:hypothetical protein